MKKLTKAEQRKLYEMFSSSVDKEATSLIALNGMSTFSLPTNAEIMQEAEDKKKAFASILEEGIIS